MHKHFITGKARLGLHNASGGDCTAQLLPDSFHIDRDTLQLAYVSGTIQRLAWLEALCLEGMGQEIKVTQRSASIY